MKTKHVESLEEIVFKDRNKQYGAYYLRKQYKNHILISLLIAVFFVGSALTYPLITGRNQKGTLKTDTLVVTADPFRKTMEEPETPPPPPESEKQEKISPFTAPKVIIDSIDSDFGKQDVLADYKPTQLSTVDDPVEKAPDKPEPVLPEVEKQEPVLWVPEMPSFPGGITEMQTYLVNNIRYPGEAREISIQGTVYLRFVVEPDGSITNITILRGIGGGCEEEALRVVKSMPNWVPGKQNGHPVRVILTLPVKFSLK
jgi:periplasmic protein TonB